MVSSKKIGVMGGTFDPIHIAHLYIAQEAIDIYGLDSVYFIPSALPPHKDTACPSGAKHRYEMTRLAVQTNPGFVISDMEVRRGGTSYTIDTISELKKNLPENSGVFFIMGFDSYMEFESWKSPDKLLEECRIITAPRRAVDREILSRGLKPGFLPMDIPVIEISSTDIRKRIACGRSIRYLVPEKVERYILENNLYKREDK